MFSGIVEEMAILTGMEQEQENIHFTLRCSFTDELKIDQSIAHNGVCLTVVRIKDDTYTVTAMKETLKRSNLGLLQVGDRVNIERSMLMNGRLDGHIVQGHVDHTAKCINMEDADGSTYFTFEYPYNREMMQRGYFTVDKGSVTVNGVSLTVCEPTANSFKVAIIPYTRTNTNFAYITIGTVVNLEFDILGKYIARLNSLSTQAAPRLTVHHLPLQFHISRCGYARERHRLLHVAPTGTVQKPVSFSCHAGMDWNTYNVCPSR